MPARTRTTTSRDVTAELAFLSRALKAPALLEAADRLAERAAAESWTHQEYLAACLQREVAVREAHGGEGRIRTARFPARKTLEEFDFTHLRGLKRQAVAHLGTLDFITSSRRLSAGRPPAALHRIAAAAVFADPGRCVGQWRCGSVPSTLRRRGRTACPVNRHLLVALFSSYR
ncbi:ATP-binding protein [Streptomyces sp. NPDC001982]|uniref:ATP-binding protein n=1 Tax=Streptomyces sp. NPDC001982 TaxID=3154405 RepID=UPI003321A7F5